MTIKKNTKNRRAERDKHFLKVQKEISSAPWVLRVTEHQDRPAPVMIIKKRLRPSERDDTENLTLPRSVLRDRGILYGQSQLRCLSIIKAILSRVQDRSGIPLELHRFFETSRISFRGNLPLEEEAGLKLALLFKLQERIKELDRVELLARRIDRFTKEEASYWYSRMTSFSSAANRWAAAGMKVMLSGHNGDKAVQEMLDELRTNF